MDEKHRASASPAGTPLGGAGEPFDWSLVDYAHVARAFANLSGSGMSFSFYLHASGRMVTVRVSDVGSSASFHIVTPAEMDVLMMQLGEADLEKVVRPLMQPFGGRARRR